MNSTAALVTLFSLCGACSERAAPDPSGAAGSDKPGSLASPVSSNAEPRVVDRSLLKTSIAEPAKLHVVAYRKSPEELGFGAQTSRAFRIFPFGDRMVVTLAGQVFNFDGSKLSLDPKAVTSDKVEGNTPVLGAYDIKRMDGAWPDELWVEAHFSTFMGRQSSSRDVSYRRHEGKWKVEKAALPSVITAWAGGGVLGVLDGRFQVISGKAPHAIQQTNPSETQGLCVTTKPIVTVEAAATATSGEVYSFGRRCDTGQYAFEWWKAGESRGTLLEIPELGSLGEFKGYGHRLVASSAKGVYLTVASAGPAFLLWRFDGEVMRRVETHDAGTANWTAATPDGAFFALLSQSDNELIGINQQGRYQRYRTGKSVNLATLWAQDQDTAYAAVDWEHGQHSAIFGTKDQRILGTPPSDLYSDKERDGANAPASAASTAAATPVVDAEVFEPFTASCETPFVYLYDVSKNSPKGFDFPRTKNALKQFGKRTTESLLDFDHKGKRRLGIRTINGEVGAALVLHMKAALPEDEPRLVCFEAPTDASEIPL